MKVFPPPNNRLYHDFIIFYTISIEGKYRITEYLHSEDDERIFWTSTDDSKSQQSFATFPCTQYITEVLDRRGVRFDTGEAVEPYFPVDKDVSLKKKIESDEKTFVWTQIECYLFAHTVHNDGKKQLNEREIWNWFDAAINARIMHSIARVLIKKLIKSSIICANDCCCRQGSISNIDFNCKRLYLWGGWMLNAWMHRVRYQTAVKLIGTLLTFQIWIWFRVDWSFRVK